MPDRSTVVNAFTSLFDSIVDGRVYRSILPQNTLFPAVKYQVVGQLPHNTFSGPSKLDFLTVDVHVYASDLAECEQIAEQIRQTVEGFDTTDSIIQSIRFHESGDDYAQNISKYHIQQEYRVTFNR